MNRTLARRVLGVASLAVAGLVGGCNGAHAPATARTGRGGPGAEASSGPAGWAAVDSRGASSRSIAATGSSAAPGHVTQPSARDRAEARPVAGDQTFWVDELTGPTELLLDLRAHGRHTYSFKAAQRAVFSIELQSLDASNQLEVEVFAGAASVESRFFWAQPVRVPFLLQNLSVAPRSTTFLSIDNSKRIHTTSVKLTITPGN